jgi:hypothetical protein
MAAEQDVRNRAIVAEGSRLVELASGAGLTLRLFGGAAVMLHCPKLLAHGGGRAIADLDVIVAPKQGPLLGKLLCADTYEPDAKFNSTYAGTWMRFDGPLGRLDIILGSFEMSHRIDLHERFLLDIPTLPVTDLLVTKLQIVKLLPKDEADALVILREHETSRGEGDVVNVEHMQDLIKGDWGLWRTVSGNLDRLTALTDEVDILRRIQEIRSSLDSAPKNTRFRLRARVGDLIPWYMNPEAER